MTDLKPVISVLEAIKNGARHSYIDAKEAAIILTALEERESMRSSCIELLNKNTDLRRRINKSDGLFHALKAAAVQFRKYQSMHLTRSVSPAADYEEMERAAVKARTNGEFSTICEDALEEYQKA